MTQSSSGGSSAGNPAAQRLESLLEWVTSQTGLSFRGQRESATDTLRRAIKRSGDANPDDFRCRLAADRAAFDDLIGELTIGETYFFRDRSQFELITNYFFQHLNKIRPPHHQIRIWMPVARRAKRSGPWRSYWPSQHFRTAAACWEQISPDRRSGRHNSVSTESGRCAVMP